MTSILKAYIIEISCSIFLSFRKNVNKNIDITTTNILFNLLDFDCLKKTDIYCLFDPPIIRKLEIKFNETFSLEALQYIVKTFDFLSFFSNIISCNIKFVDFDQYFPVFSFPENILNISIKFLILKIVTGLVTNPINDI